MRLSSSCQRSRLKANAAIECDPSPKAIGACGAVRVAKSDREQAQFSRAAMEPAALEFAYISEICVLSVCCTMVCRPSCKPLKIYSLFEMCANAIGRPDQKGSTGRDNRMFVEGVLWIVRTGSPWRDLPEPFGDWNSVFRRFSRWSQKGVWRRIFEAIKGLKIKPLGARAAA